ncbi:MAG: hypothetical protein FWF29_09170, partial [Treponema sp.]|nr:hypothetical protein [Treponema sp.]
NADVFHQYENAIPDFERLFAVQPELVVCDAHPRYFSSRLAKKIAAERNFPLVPVYHHHAHIASVMAEHGLSRVLGVAFDGSGYGEDGNIWGGEFLLCENGQCRRAGHLAYADIIGSDDAARDAAKTAACYLYSRNISLSDIPSSDISPRPVSRAENDSAFRVSDSPLIQAALAARINIFTTSGMGRLFDAVAAILGICQANSYEGQCATLLQYRAEEEEQSGIKPLDMRFDMSISEGLCIFDYSDILYKCLTRRPGAALGFHLAICGMIEQMCLRMREAEGINDIALSGGVFQNAFLLGKVKIKLAAQGFCVYTNNAVPVNDGGLALGQAFLGMRNFSG